MNDREVIRIDVARLTDVLNLAEEFCGLVLAADRAVDMPEQAEVGRRRIQRDRCLILGDRFRNLSLELERHPERLATIPEPVIQSHRLAQLGDGFIEAMRPKQSCSQVGIDDERERIQIARPPHLGDLMFALAQRSQDVTGKPVMGRGIIWI